jgi:hypothetical protein
MEQSREPKISWSGGGDGAVHLAVVDRRLVAVVYWHEEDEAWRWVAADRPYEHFLVAHAPPRRDAFGVIFTASAVVGAYLAGMDPLEASEKKSLLQAQADDQ